MEKSLKEQVKGTLIVPIGLAIVLAPYSLLVGWNVITLLLFWFIITPLLTIYLPTKASKNGNHLSESVLGLMIFYAMMVFMIYKQYKTDYFQVMMASLLVNLIVVIAISWTRMRRT